MYFNIFIFFQIVAVRLHPLLHRLPEQRDPQVSPVQKLPRQVQGRTLSLDRKTNKKENPIFEPRFEI
jgi:hypothetical protein